MKTIISLQSKIFLLGLTVIFFTACGKDEGCLREKEKKNSEFKEGQINRLTISSTGLLKEDVTNSYFQNSANDLKIDLDIVKLEIGKKKSKANGILIADGYSTSEFLVEFNASQDKKGYKGNIDWSGSLFGSGKLKVHYLNIEGNEAVVGATVTSDNWYFPQGYYIALLLRDNGKNSDTNPDQMNSNMFFSATDNGTTLTPGSTFWNTGWYTLNSQIKIEDN